MDKKVKENLEILNPLEDSKKVVAEYKKSKIKKVALVAATAGVLTVAVACSAKKETEVTELDRPDSGQGSTTVEVVADNGENEITIPVDIDEKVLTGDDLDLAFTEAEKCLDEIVLGENESYNDVCKNLFFPSKVPGTSIELTYETDIPDLIDNYGNVYMENSPEGNVGILVQINIHMKYQKKERIHIIYAYVPPKKK
jgi:hypothetical protein